MAVTMRMTVAKPASFRRLFSTSSSILPPIFGPSSTPPPISESTQQKPAPEPSHVLYVSGLNKRTTNAGLHEAFSKFGRVVNVRVVTDRLARYSKCFGFVDFATTEEATRAIKAIDGKVLDGWPICAEYARPRFKHLNNPNDAEPAAS